MSFWTSICFMMWTTQGIKRQSGKRTITRTGHIVLSTTIRLTNLRWSIKITLVNNHWFVRLWLVSKKGYGQRFENCDIRSATNFLWRFSDIEATKIEAGAYEFNYSPDTINFEHLYEQWFHTTDRGSPEQMAELLQRFIVRGYTNSDKTRQTPRLVDAYSYLLSKSSHFNVTGHLKVDI